MVVRIEDVPANRGQAATEQESAVYVCAECRYADLYAIEPRASCTYPLSRFWSRELFAGQPACGDMTPRDGVDLVLTTFRRRT